MTVLTADGFDAAIIGVGRRCGQEDIVAYDVRKVIDILMETMPEEDAWDYYEFNIVGGWHGNQTPVWVMVGEDPQEHED
jgi:hypothetical protein|tara:strand:- start:292 stop:528 length:237 start_codon:yes stop_codon:yes gene_type:complete